MYRRDGMGIKSILRHRLKKERKKRKKKQQQRGRSFERRLKIVAIFRIGLELTCYEPRASRDHARLRSWESGLSNRGSFDRSPEFRDGNANVGGRVGEVAGKKTGVDSR